MWITGSVVEKVPPGVLQVRLHRRTGLLQERLELSVGGVGNQRLVDGVEQSLMVGDLLADVRPAHVRRLAEIGFMSAPSPT